MSHLSLKITVVESGLTKTIQFSGDMSVHEVCREIRERFGLGSGGSDHGLVWPETGKWLIPSKVLDFYDLKSGDAFEYRKKHRTLKVKTMDESIKKVMIDESQVISSLVGVICEKIGITNPEEYSIMPEVPPEKAGAGKEATSPSKPAKGELLAGDESKWLNPEKTLREQGLTELDTVILKKKFFFTDQNIDRNDPVQLNLLYNQAREMIISGKHPCTAEEAAQFGAIQMQVQYGNCEPDKHKSGFIKVKDFLPPEYQKNKDVEKRIYIEHGKLQGLTELNGKFRYVQLSRSLKTYGITFFTVFDHAKKKKQKARVLLGVTKQSVVRLDVETKEILKEWRLTQLRRWAASPNSFTMDFGDYADSYYTVETPEGEQISQLIAGYIDIILKKRKDAEKEVEIDEEEQATMEEYVSPSRATNVGVVSAGHRSAVETRMHSPASAADGMRAGWGRGGGNVFPVQYGGAGGFSQAAEITGAQQALTQSLSNGFAMVNSAAADMSVAAKLPPLGNDAAAMQWKQHTVDVNAEAVAAQLASNLAAAGSLINQVTGYVDEMDYELISANIGTITSNLGQIAQGVKLLAGLQESSDDQERLLDAGRRVALATAKLLEGAQPICMGQGNKEEFYVAGRNIAMASSDFLALMGRLDVPEDGQNELLDAARGVTKAAADLVASSRPIASGLKDPEAQEFVISEARRVAETAPIVVACTGTVSPCVTTPSCLDQLIQSCMYMRDAVASLVEAAGPSPNAKQQQNLKEAAQRVEEAIAKLMEKARRGGDTTESNPLDVQYDQLTASIDTMLENMMSTEGIINNARDLTLNATQFVNMLKAAAVEIDDDDERNRLLGAARSLADATSKMVAAAKEAARNSSDPQAQGKLDRAVASVLDATNSAAGPHLRVKAFQKLQKAIKDTITSSNQLISASRTVAQSNRNQGSQLQLNQAAKRVAEVTPTLVTALKTALSNPDDSVSQSKMMQATKQILSPANALVSAAKVAAPTTADSAAQAGLLTAAKQNADDLRALEKAFRLAEEANAGMELQNAIESLQGIEDELLAALQNQNALVAADGFSLEATQMELTGAIKSVQSSVAQLLSGAMQGNDRIAGTAATDAVAALQTLTFAAMSLAASEDDLDLRSKLLDATRNIAAALAMVIGTTNSSMEDPEALASLSDLSKELNNALNSAVDLMPGQRDLDRAILGIAQILQDMARTGGVGSGTMRGESFQSAQSKLQAAATSLTVAGNKLVRASKGSAADLAEAASKFLQSFAKLADTGSIFAVATQDRSVAGRLQEIMAEVGSAGEKILVSTKSAASDPSHAGLKAALLASAKGLSESVNKLLEICSASAPGHTDCNSALQTLDVAMGKLDTVNDASVSRESYPESVVRATTSSKALGASILNLNSNARSGNMTKMASEAVELANHVVAIIDGSVRAAHLIGSSDESSVAAIAPVVDQESFSEASIEIKEACKLLVDPGSTQQQILQSAGTIARHTANLCTSCKAAAVNQDVSSLAKQQFVASAKEVATCTSALVATIKQLVMSPGDDTRGGCEAASQSLVDAVDKLVAFSMSPEFAGTQLKVGTSAAVNQKPIIDGSRALVASSQDLVGTAKLLCTDPRDDAALQLLQAEIRAVTDSIQTLVQALSSGSPGQKQCDDALQALGDSIGAIDAAIVEATVNNLVPTAGGSKSVLVDNVRALASLCDMIAKGAKTNGAQLGSSVVELPGILSKVGTGTVAIASNFDDMQAQMNLLELVKQLGDSVLAFVYAAKASGGNPKNTAGGNKADEEKTKVRTIVGKLVSTLEGSRDDSGEFGKAVEKIENVVSGLESRVPDVAPGAYQIYGSEIDAIGKKVVEVIGEVISKAKTPAQFRTLAVQIGDLYDNMGTIGGNAVASTSDVKVKQGLQDALRELGGSSIKLIEAMRMASGKSAADNVSRLKLSQSAREVSSSVANVMNAAKDGSKGLAMCQEAIGSVNDTISDLESTIIFAQAGQLDPMDSKDNFARHKDSLLAAAKQLTELVKGFITAVTGSQEELGNVAKLAVAALEALKSQIRNGATSITSTDKNMQLQLLGAARSVSESLQTLISSAANANGRAPTDPSMNELAASVKSEFQALGELIRVIKLLGDEASRGTRALDGAVTSIDQALHTLESEEPAQGTALPDEVAGLAKLLATAAANLVSASTGKQDELVAASNAIKKQVEDLCRAAKAAIEKAPDEQKAHMIEAVKKSGQAIKYLLGRIRILQESNNPANKANVQVGAKEVALSVNAIVTAASGLIPGGYVDVNDPNVIAERELLAAASAIEAAARRLASMAPAEKPREANEELSFEGQIFDAAKAIAAATAALVRSATGAQREIVARGRSGPREEAMYFSDGTWSDGLVSAAKLVAAATAELCEAANLALKGKGQNERVIVSAKAVSASTAQLLSAATVRADPSSQAQIRLRAAGKAVTNATDHLVRAAEENMAFDDTDQISSLMKAVGSGGAGGRVAEMEAQMSILKMEKELERARQKLAAVRKGKYDASNAAKGEGGGAAAGGVGKAGAKGTPRGRPAQ
ncbi:talin 1 [Blyttiomyces helicus]|uniref:Talin 1 n=1 Tax=Blyttiomyces helicus TaxID=388810 RepID=A0A4P9WP64_9FUNG|nr:talin 1 [Blyttiomyces helicus]|eukprot:RKO94095.1 talin 1 [Blyttiomyces helicus]